MDFIANPKNKKSAKIRERCQKQHAHCCKDDLTRKVDDQTALGNYFSNLASMDRHGPGKMWCICSCVKSCIMIQCNVSVKKSSYSENVSNVLHRSTQFRSLPHLHETKSNWVLQHCLMPIFLNIRCSKWAKESYILKICHTV